MNPVDAVRLALEARVMDAGELRALARRCDAVGERDTAELARGFARVVEVEGCVVPVGVRKKLDTI